LVKIAQESARWQSGKGKNALLVDRPIASATVIFLTVMPPVDRPVDRTKPSVDRPVDRPAPRVGAFNRSIGLLCLACAHYRTHRSTSPVDRSLVRLTFRSTASGSGWEFWDWKLRYFNSNKIP